MVEVGIVLWCKLEVLIMFGYVKVNGKMVIMFGVKVEFSDYVEVDGVLLNVEKFVYYLFYKLWGVVIIVYDEKGCKMVLDFFEDVLEWIYLVGCLDYDILGLLIMINDGVFVNWLIYLKYEVKKIYLVKVEGVLINVDFK